MSAKAIKQEDGNSNYDPSCNSDEEWLPSIEERMAKQTAPGMPCVFYFECNGICTILWVCTTTFKIKNKESGFLSSQEFTRIYMGSLMYIMMYHG